MTKVIIEDRKINNLIKRNVIETIREIFNDPDYGLPITPETIKRLRKSINSKKTGRVIAFDEILKKYHK